MREMKCREAARVIEALEGVDVLYLESFVLDRWLPWGTQFSDDVQVLIRHEHIEDLMAAMSKGDYVPAMFDARAGRCVPMTREKAKEAVLKLPVSPEPFFVHPAWMSETGEPDLLVRFHTTTRHGRLMLADLQEWFNERDGQRDRSMVLGGTDHETEVDRPPLWAMMLWQAGEIMNHASDCVITKEEVDKLYLVAAQQIGDDWDHVLAKARQYGLEYERRIECPAATTLLEDYRHNLGIGADELQKAEREYGARYELSHAVKALVDYGGRYRAAVPGRVWEELEQVTKDRRRKLWWYPGGQEDVPHPDARGRLGIADVEFGIYAQIEEHAGADFDYLVRHNLVEPELVISNAPPHGPWAGRTEAELGPIFSFRVP